MTATAQSIVNAAVDAAAAQMEMHGFRDLIPSLEKMFIKGVQHYSGAVPLTIITPDGDMGPDAQTLADTIEAKTGRRVTLRQKADVSLIGGAVVQYGDERIDASIHGSLQSAGKALKNNA